MCNLSVCKRKGKYQNEKKTNYIDIFIFINKKLAYSFVTKYFCWYIYIINIDCIFFNNNKKTTIIAIKLCEYNNKTTNNLRFLKYINVFILSPQTTITAKKSTKNILFYNLFFSDDIYHYHFSYRRR